MLMHYESHECDIKFVVGVVFEVKDRVLSSVLLP